MKASGAVLVGGKSRRMGVDKPLIPFGGQRMIERVVGALGQVVEEVLLVGQGAARLNWLGLPCLEDLRPGGPLAGIYTALVAARHPPSPLCAFEMSLSCTRPPRLPHAPGPATPPPPGPPRHPHCLIVACDMPFLDPPLLAYLLEQAPGWDVVVPYVDGHLEPLHAVYARSCQEVVGEMLARGETCPLDLYPRVQTRYVGPEEIAGFPGAWRSFVNLNTPQELVQVWAPIEGPCRAFARGPTF